MHVIDDAFLAMNVLQSFVNPAEEVPVGHGSVIGDDAPERIREGGCRRRSVAKRLHPSAAKGSGAPAETTGVGAVFYRATVHQLLNSR